MMMISGRMNGGSILRYSEVTNFVLSNFVPFYSNKK